jgi:2-desacetyl-2-hydroxyethyl bacteriochlorophyllide A dehydrogenase
VPRLSRSARLHGIRDLRIEEVEVPDPGPDEILVRTEACGICPTDVRKFRIGVNDGEYPFNPGHEWVGRVAEVGERVDGVAPGERVYGDVYGGYAEYVLLPVRGNAWSCGPVGIPDQLPVERAVFVEPLADCLHAVHDQARVRPGQDVLVVGCGQMGLQMTAVARRAGARVVAVDPIADRRDLAAAHGASRTVDPADGTLDAQLGPGCVDAAILTAALADAVPGLLPLLRPGGVLVLFAGFGDRGSVTLDLNAIHYRELTVVGSEWVGTPPHQRLHHYRDARDLLVEGGEFALESLVTATTTFDRLAEAFDSVAGLTGLKFVLDTRS